MATATPGRTLKRADPSTIQDKFVVGYQAWFTCPGDGPPLDPHHHGWLHWFNYPIPDGGRPNTDLWPDVSEYSPSELFPAPGLKFASGEQAFLFSSRNARTVERHFHWMALHGIDGAFLQRFLGQCDLEGGNEAIRNQRDEVGDRVREAAEKEGRVFAIMYDISGVAPDRIQRVLEKDWIHLIREKRVLDSPNYLKEKGKPVVTLWGFGMSGAGHDPATIRACTAFIRNNTPGGAYIMGGGPAYWRTSDNDADRNPEFVNVWLEEFDAISPWTIGRFGSPEHADRYAEQVVKGDLEVIRKRNEEAANAVPNRRHIDFIPVIFPGGSGFNLSEGKWGWNDIPRRGGQFLWRQLWNMRRLGIRTFYGAMWDEYDEGTAYMPVVSKKRELPVHEKYNFMALDEDGFDLPPDWYMRIAGFGAEGLRSERMIHETFPSKELQDYWSTRPRYEDKAESPGTSGKSASWEEWEKGYPRKDSKDDIPPPPYSLEVAASASQTFGEPSIPPRPTVGALNSFQNRSEKPPPAPLASRPSMSRPTGASSGPPPIPSSSRPESGGSSASPPAAMALLTEEMSRQRISSPSPSRLEPPPTHPSGPSTSTPNSPYRQNPGSGTCPNPPFPSLPYQPPYPAPPGGAAFPTPSLSPIRQSNPAPWSSPAWPPPEWGVQGPQTSQSSQSWSAYPGYQAHNNGYVPQYNAPYGPPPSSSPPPLRPRPSVSSRPHSHSPSSSPAPPSPASSAPYPSPAPGGFGFPQAQIGSGQAYAYAPQPQQAPQPYRSYGPSTYPPTAPSPTSGPYEPYPGGPDSYPYNASAGGSLTGGRPPQHPGVGHSPSVSRPPGGSSVFSTGKLQSLAHSGMSTGGKLLGKFKK